MSFNIRNREEYETGSKWYNDLHRVWGEHDKAWRNMPAIDLDLMDYCGSCSVPVLLTETTKDPDKRTTVLEHLAHLAHLPALLIRLDVRREPEPYLATLVSPFRTTYGWKTSHGLAELVRNLRETQHSCEGEKARLAWLQRRSEVV